MINWRFCNTVGRTGDGCQTREAPAKSGKLNRSVKKVKRFRVPLKCRCIAYSSVRPTHACLQLNVILCYGDLQTLVPKQTAVYCK